MTTCAWWSKGPSLRHVSMTGSQASYLDVGEAGEAIPDDLTKAEASKGTDELQDTTGRGTDSR
jgi:hypothetical protein